MNCKFCGEPVEEKPGGHRIREYCHDAHRQAYWRQQQKQDQNAALRASLEALRTIVKEQAQEIKELRERLDVERRYLSDTTPYHFRAWLRKQPSSPWRDTFLSDQVISPRGSRAYYEAQARRLLLSEEETQDFVRLWKLMLLQA
jgi:hypothetical protein